MKKCSARDQKTGKYCDDAVCDLNSNYCKTHDSFKIKCVLDYYGTVGTRNYYDIQKSRVEEYIRPNDLDDILKCKGLPLDLTMMIHSFVPDLLLEMNDKSVCTYPGLTSAIYNNKLDSMAGHVKEYVEDGITFHLIYTKGRHRTTVLRITLPKRNPNLDLIFSEQFHGHRYVTANQIKLGGKYYLFVKSCEYVYPMRLGKRTPKKVVSQCNNEAYLHDDYFLDFARTVIRYIKVTD